MKYILRLLKYVFAYLVILHKVLIALPVLYIVRFVWDFKPKKAWADVHLVLFKHFIVGGNRFEQLYFYNTVEDYVHNKKTYQ